MLFPHGRMRKGQRELYGDAREALENGTVLLASAPTGIGKTAAVLAAALEVAMERDQIVFFLTSRQSQHDIAVETLKLIARRADIRAVDVVSKRTMCPRPESESLPYASFLEFCARAVEEGRCPYYARGAQDLADRVSRNIMGVTELVKYVSSRGGCPYRVALHAMRGASAVIADYSYLFSEIGVNVLNQINRSLEDLIAIVDEAHNLPERVRGYHTSHLTRRTLENAHRAMMYYDTISANVIRTMLDGYGMDMDDLLHRALHSTLFPMRPEEFVARLERFGALDAESRGDSSLLDLATFISTWTNATESYARYFHEDAYVVRLMDPSVHTGEIFRRLGGAVLMSGTLHPQEMYADLLGIEGYVSRTYPSPFPPENRRAFHIRGFTSLYGKRGDENYRRIAETIARVHTKIGGNSAAFFPSYEFLEGVRRWISPLLPGQVLIERRDMSKEEKEALLNALRDFRGLLLLAVMGGSFSEGVDYPGEMLSGVFVVGFPHPPPSPEQEALERYFREKFGREKGYLYSTILPAVTKVIQAAGRPIRSEVDVAYIFFMEDRLLRYERYFPPGFLGRKVSGVKELLNVMEKTRR